MYMPIHACYSIHASHACMYIWIHACMHAYIHACIHTHTHTRTHTHTHTPSGIHDSLLHVASLRLLLVIDRLFHQFQLVCVPLHLTSQGPATHTHTHTLSLSLSHTHTHTGTLPAHNSDRPERASIRVLHRGTNSLSSKCTVVNICSKCTVENM